MYGMWPQGLGKPRAFFRLRMAHFRFVTWRYQVRVVEPLATFGLAYLAYLAADLFNWSGILSLIGTWPHRKLEIAAGYLKGQSHRILGYILASGKLN